MKWLKEKNKSFLISGLSVSLGLIVLVVIFFGSDRDDEQLLLLNTNVLSAQKAENNGNSIVKLSRDNCQTSSELTFAQYKSKNPGKSIQKNIGYKNNKFGLYIYALDDYIEYAGDLVNSNGGEWGYVLIPYNIKDLDNAKWRKIFSLLTEKKLIPIIQLWEVDSEKYEVQTREAATFLDSFDWPIKNRYISVYNEMNDSQFWDGEVDPKKYAVILNFTINTFKRENDNFFLLNGAFNATAPNGDGYMDQVQYMSEMDRYVPGIFSKLDGWASHSYPQPHYTGRVTDVGRGSIKTYEWELEILKNRFGIADLPVFITETGWPHKQGQNDNPAYFDQELAADLIRQAFMNVWLPDDRVVAVTPFTIYFEAPFDHFSWVKADDDAVYPQFSLIQELRKISGDPPSLVKSSKSPILCP